MASDRGILADPGTNCSIHRFFKGDAELARALFQQSREIIVEGQSGPHPDIIDVSNIDVKTSNISALAHLDDLEPPPTARVFGGPRSWKVFPNRAGIRKMYPTTSA
ncbi:MAG TPA: hypothetical protein VIX12_01110 [Candidatus Binataceae bacterium]